MQDKVDLLTDDDAAGGGDFVVDESGDLTLCTPLRCVVQDVAFRGLSAHYDYGPDPFLGANLHIYKRKTNTRRNGDYAKADLFESLVRDGRFSRNTIIVDCVPVAKNQVALPVFLRDVVLDTEEEMYDREAIPIVTFTVDFSTGEITSIDGALR